MNTPTSPHPPEKTPERVKLIQIRELRPKGEKGACLRPLGLCELGGCCDVCWYGGARRTPPCEKT